MFSSSINDSALGKKFEINGSFSCIAIDKITNKIYLGNELGEIQLFDLNEKTITLNSSIHEKKINEIIITNDSQLLTASSDFSINLINADNFSIIRSFVGHNSWVYSLSLDNDNKYFYSSSADKKIKKWYIPNGSCVNNYLVHSEWIPQVEFCERNKSIISYSEDNQLLMTDISSSKVIKEFKTFESDITCLCLTPNSDELFVGTSDGVIKQFELPSFKLKKEIEVGTEISSLISHYEGIYLIVGLENGDIAFVNPKEEDSLIQLSCSENEIIDFDLIPSKDELFIIDDDGNLIISDILQFSIKDEINKMKKEAISKKEQLIKSSKMELFASDFQPERDEFESESDYKDRVKKQENFERSILKKLDRELSALKNLYSIKIQKLTEKMFVLPLFNFELQKYNINTETFPIKVHDSIFQFKISPNKAREFKTNLKEQLFYKEVRYDSSSTMVINSLLIECRNGGTYKCLDGNSINFSSSLPPDLNCTTEFKDSNGNFILESDENAEIIVKIYNSGEGTAFDVNVNMIADRYNDYFIFTDRINIISIPAYDEAIVSFAIKGKSDLPQDNCHIKFEITETNGFNPPPVEILFQTSEAEDPQIRIETIAKDSNNNGIIETKEIVDIEVRIFNDGGTIFNATAYLNKGDHVYWAGDTKIEYEFSDISLINPRDIKFSFFVNDQVSDDIPININILSKNYNSSFPLDLKANKQIVKTQRFVVNPDKSSGDHLIADIDSNIPKYNQKNEDAVAVVIGNYGYDNPDINAAEYAINDAQSVKKYLINAFGFSEKNIIYGSNLRKIDFIEIFGEKTDYKGKLYHYVKPNISDIFIYYSGHGVPDVNSKQGYLVPSDASPDNFKLTCYSLTTLYDNLAKIDAKSITVVIDACFSGGTNNGMIINNASPIFFTVENPIVTKESSLILTACSSNEIASWYPEKKHSIFTYFFLKGLSNLADLNGDNNIEFKEMKDYLTENVPYFAKRIHSRNQNPTILYKSNKSLIRCEK